MRTEFIMRGDGAVQMRQSLAQLGHDAFLRAMREQMAARPPDGFTFGNVDFRDDPESGTFTLILSGQRVIQWQPVPGTAPAGGPRRMMFDQDLPSMELGALRPDGPFHDAPIALPPALHVATTETIILPNSGRGFSIDGQDMERVIAGMRFTRRLSLADGRVTAHWETAGIAREIGAADARASTAQLRALRDDKAYLRAPPGTVDHSRAVSVPVVRMPADGAGARPLGQEPTTAQEFNQRGYERLQATALDGADSDFAHAATLSPHWSRPVANRGIVLIHRDRYDEAEQLLAHAAELDANDFVVHQGRGLIQMSRHRPIQAIVEFTRTLELDPGNVFTLMQRASAYQQVGELDDGLADLTQVLAHEPGNQAALAARARLHAWRGEGDQAVADADALVAVDPHDPARLVMRARVLHSIGRADAATAAFAEALATIEAQAAAAPKDREHYDAMREALFAASGQTERAIAMMDARIALRANDSALLNERCWTRATANVELPRALADCDLALAHSPDNPAILDSRAFVKLRMGQYDGAIADEDAALSHAPYLPAALYTRGIAYLRKGQREAGERDLAAARRLSFDIDASYRVYGVTP